MKSWKDINWTKTELKVYDLQRKIYISSVDVDSKKRALIRKYQKELVESQEAKLVAIRRITQDNRGKNTAGVDGKKSLTATERIELLTKLQLDGSADPVRKVFIPKSDGRQRLLGIPIIRDRIKQCLVLLVLEPEWEAKFEVNSYGFRPAYSTADAKWSVTRQIQGATKYFLDADIEGCFDNINHDYLLNKLDLDRLFKRQIESWLKTGILENYKEKEEIHPNLIGTPQGGVLSPLLVNIALHGMETAITTVLKKKVKLIRYADDFVILGMELQDVLKAKEIVEEFLKPIGLKLNQNKTSIGHTMHAHEGRKPGFDFLGYHYVNHKCSVHRGVKSTKGVNNTFRQWTGPSQKSVKKYKEGLKKLMIKYKNSPLKAFIGALSARIRGWTNYFAISQCTETFTRLDGWLWKRLFRWSVKKYKTTKNALRKCWSVKGWKFGFIEKDKTFILNRHDQTRVKNHIKIIAGASIYNGNLEYFAKRVSLGNSRVARMKGLFKKQGDKCTKCKILFKPTDIIELHHQLGPDGKRNGKLEFVHGYCHDKIHGE